MLTPYAEFIEQKMRSDPETGFFPDELSDALYPFQRAARRVMNDLQPHPEERLVLDGEVELRAALARIPESKES